MQVRLHTFGGDDAIETYQSIILKATFSPRGELAFKSPPGGVRRLMIFYVIDRSEPAKLLVWRWWIRRRLPANLARTEEIIWRK